MSRINVEKARDVFPMLGQRQRRQILQLGEIGALGLDFVHHLGQAVRQRGGLREGRMSRRVPCASQCRIKVRQQQLPPHGRDGGRQLQPFADRIEQQIVFIAVAQRAELRQQRRAAQHRGEGSPKLRAARRVGR